MMQVNTSYREIIRIAMPIILGSFSQAILSVIDTAFLGRVDEVTLAAGALGSTYYLIFSLLSWAMSMGVQIIIARRSGQGKLNEISATFYQGNYLLFVFSLMLFTLMTIFTPSLMRVLIKNPQVYEKAVEFINYRSFGLFFVALGAGYRAFYIGISQTAVITYATVFMSLLNGFLDYILIFGHWGFPVMGIKGAALASALSEIAGYFVFALFSHTNAKYRIFFISRFPKPDLSLITKIINLSYPTVFQYFISIISWFFFFVIIEKTGQEKLAASNVIRSVLMMIMFPVWGFASTSNTMVSNILGQEQPKKLRKLLKRIILTNYLWVIALLPLFVFYPSAILRLITNDHYIIEMSINSLYTIFLALMIFTISANLHHALSGTGDTRSAFLIEFIAILFYLIYAYFSALILQASLQIIWLAEAIYWIIIGTLSFWKLSAGKWKKIKV